MTSQEATGTRRTEVIVFAVAWLVLVATASSGAGWTTAADHASAAIHLDRTAGAPLFDVLAGVFVRIPLGEPGFRLGLLAATLGAIALAGVVAAARALTTDVATGVVAAIVLALAPTARDAMATAHPGMLAAAGATWAIALAAAQRRRVDRRGIALAIVACAATIGAAPYLGAALLVAIAAWLARGPARGELRRIAAPAAAGVGVFVIALWIGALGALPAVAPDLAAVVASSGAGATALVVGAGLLGLAFGAATGLPGARGVGGIAVLAAVDAIAIDRDHDAVALIAILAIGIAVALRALVKALPDVKRPALVVAGAGAPLALAALLLGARVVPDDPGSTPARVATDLIDELPAGPGLVIATRAPAWHAIAYAQDVAGARPDLALVPPAAQTDVLVATALRDRVVGADVAAFGRLDPRRARPAGRGFELLGARAVTAAPPPGRARYTSKLGVELAQHADLARATYEAANGRLDVAARVAGLVAGVDPADTVAPRFGAADLAVLAVTIPGTARPPLYGYLPEAASARDDVLVLGDDLAWVASLPDEPLPASPPLGRALHARWRADLARGVDPTTDAQIAALGPAAVEATSRLASALHGAR